MSQIEVSLTHRQGDFKLDAAFTTPASGVTALFGHSGCGKTTVLRAIAGLLRVDQGRVCINGETWQEREQFIPTHQRPIAYVFQEASLFSHLSVRRNLEYGWRRVAKEQRRVQFDTVVDLLGVAPLLKRATHRLSGGERQRVAIARALLTSPQLLLMDEPLSALDHNAKQSIMPYLETLHDELGIPSLYVSHDPNEVARLADHLVFLEQGRVKACGLAADLLTRLDLPVSRYDDAAAILEGRVSTHDPTYHLTWIGMDCGRVAVSREDLPEGHYARVQILARDVSLSLRAHSDTSIINILPAKVIDSRDINPSQVLLRLQLVDGQMLLSRITRRSAVGLGICEGMTVYAQVKSVALMV
ncbi:molybdenum ABC transporter ATP-binding protein [Candidatus Venteria ishoeyi]|uniref:molybdenum ABC transporter ATP-binding protein n=1 Tax=Candidatus Venteria ishoeyi TaxID=1899563 RepID=UPI0025A66013|nr:molybdenum ABC transporter ATP-binding protein [Candidatus Venteria ishoeyi]MDM8545562.1 molybdenum ABC transporter ATP-binding protein [Candidatus Venteria ishoeyi]